MSSGKDSTATACLALETQPRESLRFVAADTGNEHELFYEYLSYLETALGIEIVRLRRDFTSEWWHRRDWIRDKAMESRAGRKYEWTEEKRDRCLSFFERGPFGNPYLDLCAIKGRFPSSQAQFCTHFLKIEPIVEWQLERIEEGHDVWSWQGIRLDESRRRRARLQGTGTCVRSFERMDDGLYTYRPILRWTAADCFEAHRCFGIKPNPLYKQGMDRVGCMPCINVGKASLREIAKRFPAHIDRIEEWEKIVGTASKRGDATFFISPDETRYVFGRGVRDYVSWAKTARGAGYKQGTFDLDTDTGCASSYGLCE